MPNQAEGTINWTLSKTDAVAILRTIRLRQDDARKVTREFPTYETFNRLVGELEVLKMKLVSQCEGSLI
tara:strand:+ start:661 stop:867 length:207 start_codon:yes stop_codon:yes gene_type:complete